MPICSIPQFTCLRSKVKPIDIAVTRHLELQANGVKCIGQGRKSLASEHTTRKKNNSGFGIMTAQSLDKSDIGGLELLQIIKSLANVVGSQVKADYIGRKSGKIPNWRLSYKCTAIECGQ